MVRLPVMTTPSMRMEVTLVAPCRNRLATEPVRNLRLLTKSSRVLDGLSWRLLLISTSPCIYVGELVCHCGNVVRAHQKISIVYILHHAVESRAQVKIGGCDDVRWRTNDRTLYDGSVYNCY